MSKTLSIYTRRDITSTYLCSQFHANFFTSRHHVRSVRGEEDYLCYEGTFGVGVLESGRAFAVL